MTSEKCFLRAKKNQFSGLPIAPSKLVSITQAPTRLAHSKHSSVCHLIPTGISATHSVTTLYYRPVTATLQNLHFLIN